MGNFLAGIPLHEIVAGAIIVPVVSLVAVWAARRIGHWTVHALQQSFGQVVLEVMSPDMAHLATKVTSALDEHAKLNSVEHAKVQGRLVSVEGRLTDVETRLAHVESKLNIRPPDARTRATDKD